MSAKLHDENILSDMAKNGVLRLAIVKSEGSFETSMVDGLKSYLPGKPIEIVAEHQVSPQEKDFRTVLTKLRAEDVDGIYLIMGGGLDKAGEFFQQAHSAKLNVPIYAWSGFENHKMIADYGPYLENSIYPLPTMQDRDLAFNAKFKARFGSEPLTPTAASSYDAMHMLAIALKNGDDPAIVKKSLLAIENYDGASPLTRFNEFGWAVVDREFDLKTVRNGTFVKLS
jgi:ABC-type branched-subunit amino acid transport system substrate-binding protein